MKIDDSSVKMFTFVRRADVLCLCNGKANAEYKYLPVSVLSRKVRRINTE